VTGPEKRPSLVEAAAAGYGTATVITGQLVGRWIADLAMLIEPRDSEAGAALDVDRWELLGGDDRERLTQVGYELLVRLDAVGALAKGRTQRLVPVIRDNHGRVLAAATSVRAVPGVPGGICTCGSPETLGMIHRIGSPCSAPQVAE
jgi:hypothetical protein